MSDSWRVSADSQQERQSRVQTPSKCPLQRGSPVRLEPKFESLRALSIFLLVFFIVLSYYLFRIQTLTPSIAREALTVCEAMTSQ